MTSPDSDARFHPPEILVPINDDFRRKDILSMDQFDEPSLEHLFIVTEQMEAYLNTHSVPRLLNGSMMISAFNEASTRTRFSFESAHQNLGGLRPLYPEGLPQIEDPAFDYRILDLGALFPDVIVMRHSQIGAPARAAEVLRKYAGVIPVINAGDGIGEHPTQAMLDMYTMKKRFGRLDGLKGVIAGDLKNGRTLHSLIRGLSCFEENTVYLLAPPELRLREEERSHFASLPINLVEIQDPEQIPKDSNFWYWTRVQKERFLNPEEYEAVKDSMVLTPKLLRRRGNKNLIIMHPGPISGEVNEIERKIVDGDPRCIYFEQAANGLPVRMALLALVLGKIK